MSISVSALKKLYGEQVAVNDISFTCSKGTITGFLGPNGAGKSTTMKMVTGYLKPDAGEANVAGIDVLKDPIKAKQRFGYLPESNALYYDLYVQEYLNFTAALYKINDIKRRVKDVIEQVGLSPEAHKKIGQLSKGYKQRVGLAAALVHDPEVLILDEPTSGLDPNQIVEIRNVIKTLSENKTVLLSTHIMQEVEALCQQVIIINKGSIIANTSLQQLKTEGQRQVLMVSFNEAVKDTAVLKELPALLNATSSNNYDWTLETNDLESLRHQVLQAALTHQWQIRQLQSGSSLEQIFQQLTQTV